MAWQPLAATRAATRADRSAAPRLEGLPAKQWTRRAQQPVVRTLHSLVPPKPERIGEEAMMDGLRERAEAVTAALRQCGLGASVVDADIFSHAFRSGCRAAGCSRLVS